MQSWIIDGIKVIGSWKLIMKGYFMNVFGAVVNKRPIEMLARYFETISGKETLNHEKIHTAQMKELGWIFFYILYGIEFFIRWVGSGFAREKAYMEISFEKEAYSNQSNLKYLSTRKHYMMWRKS